MLNIRKLQKCAKEPKLHEGETCINAQKGGSKSSQGTGEQCCEISQVAKIRNLRNLQVANFRNPAKFPLSSFSSVFLLQVSSGSIIHLQIQLRFIVFESN